jgi:3-oxoadipate enol-lactonase
MQLFFIHGAGCTPAVFDAQLRAFPQARAVALPGHAGAGHGDGPNTVAAFADAAAEQLHALPEKAVVCGSSMGGAIALELALRGDPAVAGVMLLGSGARLRVAPAIFERLRDDFSSAAAWLAGFFFADPTPERIAAAVEGLTFVGPAQTLRDFEACNAFDATERIAALRVPLFALTGEQDALTPPKFAQWFADRVPGATARILPGAGHLAMIERPEETNAAIRAFLNGL